MSGIVAPPVPLRATGRRRGGGYRGGAGWGLGRALVAVLDQRPFGVAWQARRSLQRITGVDYAYDDTSWLEYISNPTQPLG